MKAGADTTTLKDLIANRYQDKLHRQRRKLHSPCQPIVQFEGRELLSFASNDYLGLANHRSIRKALTDGVKRWGAGSGASPLISGHFAVHEELERRLAEHVGFPRALLFANGYLANLAIPAAFLDRGDAIFSDKLNHASLVDAARLSFARRHRYRHLDLDALESQLANDNVNRRLICSDTVFSMDGDIAPLPQLLTLAEKYDCWLLLDDAHGFGVLGKNGRGSLAHYGVDYHQRILLVGTMGKAAGVAGAFVAGSEEAIEWLAQNARPYIYSTSPPPATAAALLKSLQLIDKANKRRQLLGKLIKCFRDGCAHLPWSLASGSSEITPIQPLIVGDNQTALDISAMLQEHALLVPAIRPPTVPSGTARLRVSLSAAHRLVDVERLLLALHSYCPAS